MSASELVRSSLAAALVAGLVPAQAAETLPGLRLDTRPAHFIVEITHAGEFYGALLAAIGPGTVQLPTGEHVLANASVAMQGVGKVSLSQRFDLAPGLLAEADVYLQAVTLTGGILGVSPVLSMQEYLAKNPVLPDLTVRLLWTESIPAMLDFHADYLARTDGYGLWGSEVVLSGAGTDVYLKLKTPGPGEGRLDADLVEHHYVWTRLGTEPGKQVRVFVAETDGVMPLSPYGLVMVLTVPMQ